MRDFYTWQGFYRTEANGPTKASTHYACETDAKLYEITVLHGDGDKVGVFTNGKITPEGRYHREIREHYQLKANTL